MAEMKQVPALRFPEFEGEWEEKKMDDIARITSGGTPNRSKPKFWNGHIPWITTSQIDFVTINSANEFITQEGLDNSSAKLFPVGTILMAMYGQGKTRGKVSILGIEATTNQACAALILKKGFDTIFLFQYLSSKYDRIRNIANDGGQQNLSAGLIKGLKIKYPILIEQQKIATFLTALDQRLQLLQQKKTQLEAYKKGVMQKLFSQEVRFKDDNGEEYPDWEEKRLGELYSFISTNSLSREKLNYDDGLVKNIHYGDIHTKFNSHFNIIYESTPYINLDENLSKIPEENYLKKGDLVFADASEDYADIGKAIEIINLNNEKVLAGLHTLLAKKCTNEVVLGFGGHLMKSFDVRLEIMKIAQGTKVLGISATRLKDIIVKLPSLPEQQKIAAFLTALDEGIAQVAGQIEASTRYKKGLLQKMFV